MGKKFKKACAFVSAFVLVTSFMPADFFGGQVQAKEKDTKASIENPALKLKYDTMAGTNASGNAYDNGESFYKALPIGNGRVGAMVYGNYPTEKFDLNEATFWSGGPGKNDKPGAADKIDEAKQLVYDGKYKEADSFVASNIIGSLEAKYQSIGTLELEFGHDDVSDYSRQLDMNTGVVSSQYVYDGRVYHRESFVSYPDNVMVTRITSDTEGAVSFKVKYAGAIDGYTVSADGEDTLVMDGHNDSSAVSKSSLRYETRTKVIRETQSGTVKADGDKLSVEGADSVVILTSIRTNFIDYEDVSGDEKALAKEDIEKASQKSYEELYDAFEADYTELFNRVDLELGGDGGDNETPMRDRITSFGRDGDPDLVEILFQYGRYLMICGSRDSEPMNLQGLWNKFRNPAWDSKYTTNINYEMNYWPALTTNLEECFQPFVDKAADLAEAGNYTARNTFGIEDGWVVNHNTDLWNSTGPIDGEWGLWPVGGGWISNQLYDAYSFNQDPEYLEKIYPIIKGSADFLQQLMDRKEINGQEYEVIAPSNSPEIKFKTDQGDATLSYSVTMDNGISRELFQNVIEASDLLHTDGEFRDILEEKVSLIRPDQIGANGTLQEWAYDWQNNEIHHRHISHLYNLFPGNMISKTNTPSLAGAVENTLNERGDEGTGWSEGWRLNTWARLEDGNRAYKMIQLMITPVDNGGRLYDNLWDAHPPYQIDGNFGFTSGIAEMLLQSQNDEIKLLPALPDAWGTGHVSGLRARGNFEISEEWADGELTQVTIQSNSGSTCNVKYGDRFVSFPTVAGKTYTLDSNLNFTEEIDTYTNLAQDKQVTASNDTSESAALAVDGSTKTVWEDTTDNSMGGQWLTVDLGSPCSISRWTVAAPGTEDMNYVPRAFVLQKSGNGEDWEDVDAVYGNEMDVNTRNVPTFTAQYVRLYIENATQDNSGGARISEFELWGTDQTKPVEMITLNEDNITIEDGGSVTLTADVQPADAANKTVTWTSKDPEIATVTETGIVKAAAPGETEITASSWDGKITAVCKVTVTAVVVDSVKLNENELTMELEDTEQLKAQITPANASNQKVTWESSAPDVAAVDENGLVTALSEGTAVITVMTEDGQKSDTCEITVVKAIPRNVALNAKATANGNNSGEGPECAVDGSTGTKWCYDGKGNILTLDLGAEYIIDKWVIVSAGIAEDPSLNMRACRIQISPDGQNDWTDVDAVTDNSETTMERTMEQPFTARYVRLVVDEPVQENAPSYLPPAARIHEFELWGIAAPVVAEGVTLDQEELSLTEGDEAKLTATVTPENADNTNVTWKSGNEEVAMVDGEGNVTALAPGMAVITVTTEDGGFTAECTVKVKSKEEVNKACLERLLNTAKGYVNDGTIDELVPDIQTLFKEAIANGEAVMNDEYATKEEVFDACKQLLDAINALSMEEGDIAALEMAVELAETIEPNLSDYLEEGQEEFAEALAEARELLKDENQLKEDVNDSFDRLMTAMEKLRLKANKEILEKLLDEVGEIDLTKYTDDSVAELQAALKTAQEVFDNPNLTMSDQEIVNNAVLALQAAKDSLTEKTDESGDENKDPDKEDPGKEDPDKEDQDISDPDKGNQDSGTDAGQAGDNNNTAGGSGNGTTGDGTSSGSGSADRGQSADKPVQTGDATPVAGTMAVLLVSGAAVAAVLKKRRR